MEKSEYTDEKGRRYLAWTDGNDQHIIIGPPEGLVDSLGIPEPTATNLHNILYNRGLFNYAMASKTGNGLIGALQEALTLDAQRLLEAYFKYENTGGSP
jgi:hypothetical protein